MVQVKRCAMRMLRHVPADQDRDTCRSHHHSVVSAGSRLNMMICSNQQRRLTERSIRISRLLRSSASRSMPTRSRSSYSLSASSNSSLEARMAARSFSSVVKRSESLSFFGLGGSCSRSRSTDCRPSLSLGLSVVVLPAASRERSAWAKAHGICAEMSSCEARQRA